MKLFYVILGATPQGRNIEQHDVFFGIAENLDDLIPEMKTFWPGVKLHMDASQVIEHVDGHRVEIIEKCGREDDNKLFFLNLGGYKDGFFEEFHQQILFVAKSMGEAVQKAKQAEFYRTMGFEGAVSHIDDKHGVDIDDVHNVHDILPAKMKEKYSIRLVKTDETPMQNQMKLGYLKL